jgi:uncharacterized protein (DUF433 family)
MTQKPGRRRWQIELGPREERIVSKIVPALGANESEAGRRLLELVDVLMEHIGRGFTITALPDGDERAVDIVPALSRTVRPELSYEHLVRVPHRWRRQLSLKGRRITVGQLVGQMRANDWDVNRTSSELELSREAVIEALDYASRYANLIAEEAAEEKRAVENATTAL